MHRKPLTTPGALPPKPQIRKIAFEEHFLVPEGMEKDASGKVSQKDIDKHANENGLTPQWFQQIYDRMMDFDEARIESMDAAGIDLSLLSFMCPGLQGMTDARKAQEMARVVNDKLAEKIAKRPDRFAGMATLALHDADVAARELERCVKELGFKGLLINGCSQVGSEDNLVYLDEAHCNPVWEAMQDLDVPMYLHPRSPVQQLMFKGHHNLICANWGYTCETGTHAVRILVGGVFDRFPRAQMILGHLGEAVPFMAWRIQHWQEFNPGHDHPQKRVEDYLAQNVHVTIAGNFSTPAFNCAMQVMGSDRILFSTDYPFENMEDAASWFEACPMAEVDRIKIAHGNAKKLFKLA